MPAEEAKPNESRKLFFGLFIFPLLIAVGMAILLCSVIFLTHEEETAESLITAIKTGSPSKRWQKAYELSNELNQKKPGIRSESVLNEIIHIFEDPGHYDAKTRSYMALALSHFEAPEAVRSLRKSLKESEPEVQLYAAWALGNLGAKEAAPDLYPFLKTEHDELRKMAAYVLGVLGNKESVSPLESLLDDPVPDVKWNAALSLARLGDDSGHDILLQMLERQALSQSYGLSDAQIEQVMINATKGLALIHNPKSIKILETIARGDKSLKVRQAAMNALEYQRGRRNTSD